MNGKAIYLIFPLAMIILGGAITDALAATLAGKVAIVRGKVTAVAEDGQKRNLAAKSPIYVNDTIETAANSQAQILFEDETVYTIGPQSDLKIDQFVYNPEKSVGDLVVGATKGSFRMITGSIAKKAPERVKVRTPVATIGIRGTYFAGIFNGATLNTLLVGGAIFIDNPAGGREIRTPGFGTKVHSNAKAPEPPIKFTQQEIKQILAPTELMAMAPAPNTADGTTTTTTADGTTTTTTADGTTTTTTADGSTSTMTLADPSLSTQTPLTSTTNTSPTTTTVVVQTPPSQPITTIPTYSLGGKYVGAAGTTIWTGGVSGSALATDTVRNYSLTYGGSLANLSLNAPVVNSTATPYTVQGPYSFPAQNFWGYSYPAGSAWYDGRGEFSYFISPGTNQFAGYAGAPIGSAVAPTSGIGIYYGRAAAVFTDGSHEADKMRLYINWGTNKVFGSIGDRLQDQIFVKGIYDPLTKTITNAEVFGKGLAGAGAEEFVSSNPFSMEFFGSAMQGIGGIVTGFDKNVAGTTIYDWNAMTAAIGDRNAVLTPRTNNEIYNGGFVSAISVPRNGAALSDLTLLTNVVAGDVRLRLYRNDGMLDGISSIAGTIGGYFNNVTGTSISGTPQTHTLNAVNLNASNSYYVDDNAFVNTSLGVSGNVGGNGITDVTGGDFLGTNPNLWDAPATNDPNNINIISYGHLTWGYWAAEYTAAGTQYNITPGSYWLAGQLTPNGSVPITGTGTYTGPAMGQAYQKTGSPAFYTLKGTTNLTADFSTGALNATLTMSGYTDPNNIATQKNWTIQCSGCNFTVGNNSFGGNPSVTINGVNYGTAGSAMNGAFFTTFDSKTASDVPAGAVGGNWSFNGANDAATGIFVGKK